MQHAIVLFDGECNFCHGSVQFIIKRDPKAHIKFASLQSEFGQQLVANFPEYKDLDSFLLINGEQIYAKSRAAFHICKYLKGGWKVFYLLRFFPNRLTDYFYDQFAKRRYKWFGKSDQCLLPTPELKSRFLDL